MMAKMLSVMTLVIPMALTLVGCSSDSGPGSITVTGQVMFDGQPIEEGHIFFASATGVEPTYAGKITGGYYKLKLEPGTKTIQITARREVPGKVSTANPGETSPVLEQYIPTEYNEKSTLQADIQPEGDTTFDFELSRVK